MLKILIAAILALALVAPANAYAADLREYTVAMEEIANTADAEIYAMDTRDFEELVRTLVNLESDNAKANDRENQAFYIGEDFLADHDPASRNDVYDEHMKKTNALMERYDFASGKLSDRWKKYMASENAKALSWYRSEFPNTDIAAQAEEIDAEAGIDAWESYLATKSTEELMLLEPEVWEQIICAAFDSYERMSINPRTLPANFFADKDAANRNSEYDELAADCFTALEIFMQNAGVSPASKREKLALVYFANYNAKAKSALLAEKPGVASAMDEALVSANQTGEEVVTDPSTGREMKVETDENGNKTVVKEETAADAVMGNLLADPIVLVALVVIGFGLAAKFLGGSKKKGSERGSRGGRKRVG